MVERSSIEALATRSVFTYHANRLKLVYSSCSAPGIIIFFTSRIVLACVQPFEPSLYLSTIETFLTKVGNRHFLYQYVALNPLCNESTSSVKLRCHDRSFLELPSAHKSHNRNLQRGMRSRGKSRHRYRASRKGQPLLRNNMRITHNIYIGFHGENLDECRQV